ncbi:MAG TPA: carboxymuconolactone decarboxylase family protein [Micropepsaceae bacterium]|jgi:4-carboxymuconolactone decarboxylase|nr:carboxymuconolactone decarboxylase family protein [Micropepsaceae bacterium]
MTSKSRYRAFQREELSPEQQSVFDAIGAPRGGVVPAPFHLLLESPELASLTSALGAFCRYRTGFPPKLSELVVLITASHWKCEFEFAVHSREAAKAGISESVIEALRVGRLPEFQDEESKLLYDFATTFFTARDVPDTLFDKTVTKFGRRRVVELAGVLGYYSGLAILMRIFRVPADA